ncbi:hypothetical protein PRUPE_7G229300 [Prunus persica]|uniref:PREDICTED: CARUB_v10024318mg n=2 Tax=Prunus TaxID=3754 RepID=A0A5E4E6J3_PRUDU|nr:hypothetical protein L3X38_040158 [Prunus dulcis]ONH98106.1 hypothetical protein PRUPE_7G229300 [Prunus persica]VVA10589.1 PREDICTED: CARUB_v10024318mg [Prunus dulcis]
MDIRNWCSSGSSKTIHLGGRHYDEIDCMRLRSDSGSRSNKLRWKVLWVKLKKEKRKIFESPAPVQVSYDPYTYSQNFDQGCALDELDEYDDLSRSFSMRFADPSNIFLKKESMV